MHECSNDKPEGMIGPGASRTCRSIAPRGRALFPLQVEKASNFLA